MVEHPIDYPWSSYRVIAGEKPQRQLVMQNEVDPLNIMTLHNKYKGNS